MFDSSTIRSMQREAAAKAAKDHKQPYIVWPEDLADWKERLDAGTLPRLPFPFIGEYLPKGWKKTENEYFVDSSGMGADYEPALTIPKFVGKLRVNYGYALTEVGQFQVYIQEYEKIAKKPAKEAKSAIPVAA